jgi:hypothetical protein
VTRRTVPIMFSMMFVQASERRSSAGRPSLLTVRVCILRCRPSTSSASRLLLGRDVVTHVAVWVTEIVGQFAHSEIRDVVGASATWRAIETS